jgi:hypothetical protein
MRLRDREFAGGGCATKAAEAAYLKWWFCQSGNGTTARAFSGGAGMPGLGSVFFEKLCKPKSLMQPPSSVAAPVFT